jgi:hypothetical protein
MKITALITVSLLLLTVPVSAEQVHPRMLHYSHLADGRLVWHYSEGWQIMRSYRRSERDARQELFLYTVFHDDQPVATVATLPEAKRVVGARR